MKRIIEISKAAGRSLNDAKIKLQLETIVNSVNTAQRTARGWNVAIPTPMYSQHNLTYRVGLIVTCTKPDRPTIDSEFANIVNSVAARGSGPKWEVTAIDGEKYTPDTLAAQQAEDIEIGYAPIDMPENWSSFFGHLYGLNDHIGRVRRAIDAAMMSNWQHRFHAALIGPPGCGKSDICQSIKRALGDEAVMEFDGTSTTMAGAQKELSEREELPRVLLVEEIEKAPEASMAWLLSVLDLRAEIRKTTARGNILRDCKMLCIATVNDVPTFERANFGALQSRFSNKVFFQRPSRELLSQILNREIQRVGGDERWIGPALNYAEEIDTTDPREVIAICLCGREALITGEYQSMMRRTSRGR